MWNRLQGLDAETISVAVLDSYGITSVSQSVPVENRQQEIPEQAWIKVLDLPPKPLGLEFDFLMLGGDLITVINLTSCLRKQGS